MSQKKIYFAIVLILWIIPHNSFSQTSDTSSRQENILFTDFLSSQKNADTVAVANKLYFYGFFKLLNCTSGDLYFSGNGFSQIMSIKYTGNADELKSYFDRCVSGSKFTFENCSFPRDGGLQPLILSKSVLFL